MAGGLNLYGYANGDPVNFRDPSGLTAECDEPGTPECPVVPLGGIDVNVPGPTADDLRIRLDLETAPCGNGFIQFFRECVPLSRQYRDLAPTAVGGGGSSSPGIRSIIPDAQCVASAGAFLVDAIGSVAFFTGVGTGAIVLIRANQVRRVAFIAKGTTGSRMLGYASLQRDVGRFQVGVGASGAAVASTDNVGTAMSGWVASDPSLGDFVPGLSTWRAGRSAIAACF